MLPSWANDSITVIEPSWVDDRGTPVPDYDNPVSSITMSGCSVQPGASTEDRDMRQGVTVRWTAFAPPGTAITAHSAVEYGGIRYSVDGEPARWSSPSGGLSHVQAQLVDWRG